MATLTWRLAAALPDEPAGLLSPAAARQRTSLQSQAHRPFPPPDDAWVMGQSWRRLLFAHWAIAPEDMRALVPDELPLDLYHGRAWLGVTPFEMEGVRPRGAPPAPFLSRFPELNVRTYVVGHGRPGIHFFSLDTSNRPTVAGARSLFRLPYFRACMAIRARGGWIEYAHRRSPDVAFVARYRPTGPAALAAPGTLEHWLTERYCAYAVDAGRVLRIDIHHRPWELQPAEAEIAANSVAPLPLAGAPHLMYAARQDIVVWPPR
jgi:uncharacterized protein YqjF (DUF2071 family)